MNKNYMEEIAKLLGVELEEEFICKEVNGDEVYRGKLTKKGFLGSKEDGTFWSYNWPWEDLLTGAFIIEKLPWKPKKGEKYYYPGGHFESVHSSTWGNYPSEIAVRQVGFVFRTYEECEASLATLRKKYLGGNDNE